MNSVIEGLPRLLYGALVPVLLVPRYEYSDEPLFQYLGEIPTSTEAYLSQFVDFAHRWTYQLDQLPGGWALAFYKLPEAFIYFCLTCALRGHQAVIL